MSKIITTTLIVVQTTAVVLTYCYKIGSCHTLHVHMHVIADQLSEVGSTGPIRDLKKGEFSLSFQVEVVMLSVVASTVIHSPLLL